MSRCNNLRARLVSQGGRVTITIHDNHSLSSFKELEIMTYSPPCVSDFITALSLWVACDGAVLLSRLLRCGCQTPDSRSSCLSGMFTGCAPLQHHPPPSVQIDVVEANFQSPAQCLSSSVVWAGSHENMCDIVSGAKDNVSDQRPHADNCPSFHREKFLRHDADDKL